jgi:hypothetical protein
MEEELNNISDITNSIDIKEDNNMDNICKQKENYKEAELRSEISNEKFKNKTTQKELRLEKIDELNEEYKNLMIENNFENALTIMKKLIFFEPNSKLIK